MGPKLAVCGLCCGGLGLLASLVWPATQPNELPVREIPLRGPLADQESEISGLGWMGDELVVLPQFPAAFSVDGVGSVFAYSRAQLRGYLTEGAAVPEPRRVAFDAGPIGHIEGFDGFESIAFRGNQVFATVEVERKDQTFGYLVRGRVSEDRSRIAMEGEGAQLSAQSDIEDLAYEALVIEEDRVVAFFEAACNLDKVPVAHTFDFDLNPAGDMPVDLQFRLTDATTVDRNGHFWVSNYYWGGDDWEAGACPLQERFGVGSSHQQTRTVERLVELKATESGIEVLDSAPLQLALNDKPRNWEGIARFEDAGLIIATDEHPKSMLAFVAFQSR